MKPVLYNIKANFTGGVRHDQMEGRDYLVAPMIMIVEGVLNDYLYPAEELNKFPEIWNSKPVIVYHPQEADGGMISACDPDILTNRKIGVIMNTKFDSGKLKAEAWLEESRMDKVDERIANAIEKNEMMELSTGLFADSEGAEGEFNGKTYSAILRNYRPDHLALLPDLKGACSIEDGAGFLRLNAKSDKIHIVENAMSHGNIRSLLNSWLQDKDEDSWVEAVYDDFFVFLRDGVYFKGNYSIVDNAIEAENVFTEVVRVNEWRTTNGDFVGNKKEKEKEDVNNRKDNEMDKKQTVDALITCSTNSWGEDERETLMAMDEKILTKMQEGDTAAKTAVENAAKKGADDLLAVQKKEKTEQEIKGNEEKEDAKPRTTEEFIADAPPEIASVLNAGMDSLNANKAALIKIIMTNEKNKFTEEQLKAKDLSELKSIATLAAPDVIPEAPLDFSGQGEIAENVEKVEPLIAPPVVNAEPEKKE